MNVEVRGVRMECLTVVLRSSDENLQVAQPLTICSAR